MQTVEQLMETAASAAAAPMMGTWEDSETQLFDLSLSPPDKKRRGRSDSSQRIPGVTALAATPRAASRPRADPSPARRRARPAPSKDWGLTAPGDFEGKVKEAIDGIIHMTKDLEERTAELTRLELQGRQRDAALKSEIDGAVQGLGAFQPKIHDIEHDVNRIKNVLEKHEEHETGMQDYLEKLHAQRPREGQAVMAAFRHLDHEIESLKAHLASGPSYGAAISPQDSERVQAIEVKVQALFQQHEAGVLQSLFGIAEQQAQRIAQLECAAARPADAPGLPTAPCQPCGSGFAATGQQWTGGCCAPTETHGPYPVAPGARGPLASGHAGSSGNGLPPYVATTVGGNGMCHCVHVEPIHARVLYLEQLPRVHPHGQE